VFFAVRYLYRFSCNQTAVIFSAAILFVCILLLYLNVIVERCVVDFSLFRSLYLLNVKFNLQSMFPSFLQIIPFSHYFEMGEAFFSSKKCSFFLSLFILFVSSVNLPFVLGFWRRTTISASRMQKKKRRKSRPSVGFTKVDQRRAINVYSRSKGLL
jgi:hypothetical protein